MGFNSVGLFGFWVPVPGMEGVFWLSTNLFPLPLPSMTSAQEVCDLDYDCRLKDTK
jgi:hypothetical protein